MDFQGCWAIFEPGRPPEFFGGRFLDWHRSLAVRFSMPQSKLAELAAHPAVFAFGVGIANGVIAAVRDKPFDTESALITAGVISVGEVALVRGLPPTQRPNLPRFGAVTFLGTLAGLVPFTSFGGGKPMLQLIAEGAVPAPTGGWR